MVDRGHKELLDSFSLLGDVLVYVREADGISVGCPYLIT